MDVSASMDRGEVALQRAGLAAALTAPEVVEAFLISPSPVAIYAYEWSGPNAQTTLLGWTLINDAATLERVATYVQRQVPSPPGRTTALGHALGFAASALRAAPVCTSQTIDVSGDGPNNDGFGPTDAFAAFSLAGVTVNGLAITGAYDNVVSYYEQRLRRGPGSFVEVANGLDDFEAAMRRKLVREVSAIAIGSIAQ